jgi:hypothetical protein
MSLLDEVQPAQAKATVEIDAGGADVRNVVIEGDLNGDWGRLLRHFKLDPECFEVVDDTVRMSTWEQSARSKAGDRDKTQLWSYSARFRRINKQMVRPEVLESWRNHLMKLKPATRSSTVDGVYLILIADPQLGKKGTAEAVENWKRGVLAHLDEAERLNAQAVHVAWMGDETEGVCNNYGNQAHTIELNQSQQLELDFDLRVWTLEQVLARGFTVSASSVISNHGEWTRNGSKEPVTSSNDNASTHIARLVQKTFQRTGHHIDWTIGDAAPGITITLGGIECYFSHGYKEKGRGTSSETRTRSAIERQILGRTEDLGTTKLWFMAHYHHCYSNEFEGRTVFGCPALEAEKSSEYMLDQYGVWSPAGMLGMVIGGTSRGWRNANVF